MDAKRIAMTLLALALLVSTAYAAINDIEVWSTDGTDHNATVTYACVRDDSNIIVEFADGTNDDCYVFTVVTGTDYNILDFNMGDINIGVWNGTEGDQNCVNASGAGDINTSFKVPANYYGPLDINIWDINGETDQNVITVYVVPTWTFTEYTLSSLSTETAGVTDVCDIEVFDTFDKFRITKRTDQNYYVEFQEDLNLTSDIDFDTHMEMTVQDGDTAPLIEMNTQQLPVFGSVKSKVQFTNLTFNDMPKIMYAPDVDEQLQECNPDVCVNPQYDSGTLDIDVEQFSAIGAEREGGRANLIRTILPGAGAGGITGTTVLLIAVIIAIAIVVYKWKIK